MNSKAFIVYSLLLATVFAGTVVASITDTKQDGENHVEDLESSCKYGNCAQAGEVLFAEEDNAKYELNHGGDDLDEVIGGNEDRLNSAQIDLKKGGGHGGGSGQGGQKGGGGGQGGQKGGGGGHGGQKGGGGGQGGQKGGGGGGQGGHKGGGGGGQGGHKGGGGSGGKGGHGGGGHGSGGGGRGGGGGGGM